VRTLAEVIADPHLRQREALRDIDHPNIGTITLPQSPNRFDGRHPAEPHPSPAVGRASRASMKTAMRLRRRPDHIIDQSAEGGGSDLAAPFVALRPRSLP